MLKISRLITFQSIINEPLPEIAWLIKPLISVEDKTIIYGEWGTFKTWLLLDLALHLSAGKDWLEHFPIPVAKRVLYIDEEMSELILRRRVKQLSLGANLEHEDLPLVLCSRPGFVCDETEPQKLLAYLKTQSFDPEVIIIETFTRVMEGDENTARDTRQFRKNLEQLRGDERTIILSHHMGKPV